MAEEDFPPFVAQMSAFEEPIPVLHALLELYADEFPPFALIKSMVISLILSKLTEASTVPVFVYVSVFSVKNEPPAPPPPPPPATSVKLI